MSTRNQSPAAGLSTTERAVGTLIPVDVVNGVIGQGGTRVPAWGIHGDLAAVADVNDVHAEPEDAERVNARGTVAVRMPQHPVALDVLSSTGPLAVSSANRTGHPAPATADPALPVGWLVGGVLALGAAMAVGSASAHNPLSIVVPCHRVVPTTRCRSWCPATG